MCGIVSIFNLREQTPELRQKALRMSRKIRHRGPDWSGIYCGGSAILAHERLSIVDPESGGQPLFSPDGKQAPTVRLFSRSIATKASTFLRTLVASLPLPSTMRSAMSFSLHATP